MDKKLDELHNREDPGSFSASLLLFVGIMLALSILGMIFWSAF